MNLFKQRIQDCFMQEWHDNINNSNKLQLYSNIIHCFKPAAYLDVLREKKFISNMAKFRCSNHMLEIEVGRHTTNTITRDDRICKFCKTFKSTDVIEDEFHFMFVCPAFDGIRGNILGEILKDRRSNLQTFHNIMKSEEEHVIKKLSLYLYHAFCIRKNVYVS